MATITPFEDLTVWQKARVLDRLVFRATKKEELRREYRLIDQWKGASGSVMDNIAEGFDRQGNKEFIQFLSIARGSIGEVQSQVYRIRDRDYISESEFDEIYTCAKEVKDLVDKLIGYLKKSEIKGYKYFKKDS